MQQQNDVLWIHHVRPRTAWYLLSEEVRNEASARWQAVREQSQRAGGRYDGRYHSRGWSDFEQVEVWHFRSFEDVERHWDALEQAGYSDLMVAQNLIGT